jgi:RHS repeat-associated protein
MPDTVPQILTQRAAPELEDAERDRPGRLSADFAYGYTRTFASWEHGAAVFHQDAYGSAVRTEDTEPWTQAEHYEVFGAPETLGREGQERRIEGGRGLRPPEFPRFGYRGELALGPLIYLRARVYDAAFGRFTTRDPVPVVPVPGQVTNPYAYAANDPLNVTDPTGGQFGGFIHALERGGDIIGHDIRTGFDRSRHAAATIGHDARDLLDRGRHDAASFLRDGGRDVRTIFDRARHDIATTVDDIAGLFAILGLLIIARIVARLIRKEVALDANPIIAALVEGRLQDVDKALDRRVPVISPRALQESTAIGHPTRVAVMAFLARRAGRIGPEARPAQVTGLEELASNIGRVLRLRDAEVLDSAIQDDLPIITNDRRFYRFMNAINYPNERY